MRDHGTEPTILPAWLTGWQAGPVSTRDALARFDALSAVEPADLIGRWRGSGLATGHPWDGLLERLGWEGKTFRSLDDVDPLLFRTGNGAIAIEPARIPVAFLARRPGLAHAPLPAAIFDGTRLLLRATGPCARLRLVAHRGIVSAAMIYDSHPIIDHFRRIDADRVLGVMDCRFLPQPFFFLLTRVVSPPGQSARS